MKKIFINNKKYNVVADDYIQNYSIFEPEMVNLFQTLINKNDVVLDVGANVGLTSILFCELAKNVFSYEPSKNTFENLKINLENSGYNNFHINNFGLGEKKEELILTYNPKNKTNAFINNVNFSNYSESQNLISEKVQIKRLDDLSIEIIPNGTSETINFIKIDVEGFEIDVIKGGLKLINKEKPIIILEMNPFCINCFKRLDLPSFVDFLNNTFPICFALHKNTYLNLKNIDELSFVLHENIVNLKYLNILCTFDENKLINFKTKFKHQYYYGNDEIKSLFEYLNKRVFNLSLKRFLRKRGII